MVRVMMDCIHEHRDIRPSRDGETADLISLDRLAWQPPGRRTQSHTLDDYAGAQVSCKPNCRSYRSRPVSISSPSIKARFRQAHDSAPLVALS